MFKGELLHSFIFRKQLVYGGSEFSNLIGIRGKWHYWPVIIPGTDYYYSNYSERYLLTLLRSNNFALLEEGIFSNPKSYLEDMKKVFFPDEGNHKKSCIGEQGYHDIVFCDSCIHDSVKKNGVGYLKFTWLTETHCNIHNTQLLRITPTTRGKTIQLLIHVLKGKVPEGSEPYKLPTLTRPYYYNSHSRRSYFNSFLEKKAPLTMAKCLAASFHQWVRNNGHFFDETVSRKLLFKKKKDFLIALQSRSGGIGSIDEGQLACLFFSLNELHHEKLADFLSNSAKEVEVWFGVKSGRSLSETIFKSDNCDCHKCPNIGWAKSCPASQERKS